MTHWILGGSSLSGVFIAIIFYYYYILFYLLYFFFFFENTSRQCFFDHFINSIHNTLLDSHFGLIMYPNKRSVVREAEVTERV